LSWRSLVGIYCSSGATGGERVEQLKRIAAEWEAEPMLRARLEIARRRRTGARERLGLVGNYWESVASLSAATSTNASSPGSGYGGNGGLRWRYDAQPPPGSEDPTIFENFEAGWEKQRIRAGGRAARYERPS
jgi:hypothetical protein